MTPTRGQLLDELRMLLANAFSGDQGGFVLTFGDVLDLRAQVNRVFTDFLTATTESGTTDSESNVLPFVQREDTQPTDPYLCQQCGHSHAGPMFGFICIGCPCAARPVPVAGERVEWRS